ncbi:MAG: proton-conducting membrane transporter [Oscillospiraceae bacterium]|nr:proton-conducting membrane transporter [Oscillospiraceae bacterium]
MMLVPILLPLLGGLLVFLLKGEKLRTAAVLATLAATAVSMYRLAVAAVQPLVLLELAGGLTIRFAADGVGLLFAAVMLFAWLFVVPFAVPYIHHEGHERRYFGFYTMTAGILMGLCLAGNFLTMYLFYECMTLITVPLVLHTGTKEAQHAAIKYLGYSVAGAALALFGAFMAAQWGGMGDFAPGGILAAAPPAAVAAWFLMFMGFGCKAGILPLQAWLTTAHPVAPAPASAVLSGIITKGGVLAIVRATYFIFGAEILRGSWAQRTLFTLVLLTVFTGSMLAWKEKRLKRRLAYSTISQVSYALLGLLLLSTQGVLGALLQIVFHALAKNALFLSAGAMIYRTGRLECREYRGIGREMPVTLGCFALAALSLVGVPPCGGFYAKWFLALGAMEQGLGFGVAAASVLLASALLTALYLLPIVADGFFPGEDFVPREKEAPWAMCFSTLVFSLGVLVLGVFSAPLERILSAVAASLF